MDFPSRSPPPPALIPPEEIAATAERGKEILIVTGALDDLAPVGPLEAALGDVGAVELVVLSETDHFFMTGLAELAQAVTRWLEP